MRSALLGTLTSAIEVTNISVHGFWILVHGRELFVPFDQFPWFRDARVGEISKVTLQGQDHLYWPDLDIDLAVASIEHPERFPLVSKARPARGLVSSGRSKRSRLGSSRRDAHH